MEPIDILDAAICKFNPRYVIAMFSGGHDSLVATHVAKQHPRFSFACHINTGIGIEQTREFVRQTCQAWGIELREYKAAEYVRADGVPDPQIYEQIIKQYGFPGPSQHGTMYARLKERPIRMMVRELDRSPKDRVMLVTGVRQQESTRRMRHVRPIQIWEGTKIWMAPIWKFTKCDINHYISDNHLKRNPVVDLLHHSDECLCSAFAHKGEKEEIRQWYPNVANELDRLEQVAYDAGFPWGWEEGPPEWFIKSQAGQLFLGGFEPSGIPMLCMNCELAVMES